MTNFSDGEENSFGSNPEEDPIFLAEKRYKGVADSVASLGKYFLGDSEEIGFFRRYLDKSAEVMSRELSSEQPALVHFVEQSRRTIPRNVEIIAEICHSVIDVNFDKLVDERVKNSDFLHYASPEIYGSHLDSFRRAKISGLLSTCFRNGVEVLDCLNDTLYAFSVALKSSQEPYPAGVKALEAYVAEARDFLSEAMTDLRKNLMIARI